ncbi:acetyl-CoA carboxylase biotin carboxyl carrier protein [Macrococcus equipercicus]|uniref:Biotin carboxyl carrier protein of acetyl-CoA carboxylase n=1 Tax=Macrococcus equipercicus TaxID=69967 RepID=A0A9Q9F2K5_9STAP|nr:acetyl-CoA carboxylase biotin carboxyl carrier protein [Macrococcus equipercicus]KAA1040123.1 acetyl-CoA carboxylase biotin carboxyl carrier protein [Macrococcus equipercicus]UTH12929.1 acetyl-CoA carboxylase biotin carboxyl carrier protein [Macrococcus equipercicus]
MNFEELKELIDLLDQSSLTMIEVEEDNHKIKLKKETIVQVAQTAPVQAVPQVQAPAAEVERPQEEPAAEGRTINAPMVGTFYKSPTPESGAYVKVGDQVSAESVVCILEAMKLFNEIQAELSGEIVEILVEDGQMVEYGQPLFRVK